MTSFETWDERAAGYTTVEMLLEDASKQMAPSHAGNLSRGSQGQRTGGSMRIVKPNSTSNSPRGSMGIGRRRTVMNDGAYRRKVAMLEQQNAMAAGNFNSTGNFQVPSRTARPMSWHPASQPTYQPMFSGQNSDYQQQQTYDMQPAPPILYGYTSPESSISPSSMAYTSNEHQQYLHQNSATFQPPQQQAHCSQQTQHIVSQGNMYSHFDWHTLATNDFDATTSPPTPEPFLLIQRPEPALSAEESIPYQPLEDSEVGGEVLIGMGLYDTPDLMKNSSMDPQLDTYRALMMSHLFDSGHRRTESTGKGLKLEETWEPPASESDDEDEDQDGEGDDEEEVEEIESDVVSHNLPHRPQAVAPVHAYSG